MSERTSYSVRTWLVALVMSCALPLLLFSSFLIYRDAEAEAKQAERMVHDRVRLLAEDIDRELARLIAAAEVLATSEELARRDFAAFYERSAQVRDKLGTNVVLRDLTGRQFINTRVPWGTPLPSFSANEVDRKVAETKQPQVSGLLAGKLAPHPILAVIVPVIDGGEPVYLLSFTISPDRLHAIIFPSRLPQGWRAAIIDQNSVVIARSHDAERFVGKALPQELRHADASAAEGVYRANNLDGVPSFVSYSRSRSSGWLIVVSVPEKAMVAPAHRTLMLFAGGGGVIVLLAVGIAALLGRRLTHSVMELAAAAEAIGAGRCPAMRPTARARGVLEIDAVSRAIREAADLIQSRTAALNESENRYRAIVETAVDAIAVIDGTGSIQSVNPSAERLFGYRADELVQQPMHRLVPKPEGGTDDHPPASGRRPAEDNPAGVGCQATGRRKDGTTFPLELDIASWCADGNAYFTWIMRDITERKRTEAALLASKAESDRANLAKTKFLAAVSHDLRQPVQALVFFHTALADRLGEPSSRTLLGRMGEALGGLRVMLDRLLDVSRLDAGLVAAKPEDMAVGELLERLHGQYRFQAEAKRIDLRLVSTSAAVRSDPVLLETMLRNLIENALRYTKSGKVLLGCRRRGDRLRIEVVDTGIGIAPDMQGEIFEEFIQVGNPERDQSKGLGLGLAVVRRLARLLGHNVAVRSVPGRGSAFSVDVPLAARAVPERRSEDEPAKDDRGRLVLIIDDEALVRMGLQVTLEGWNYRVLAADSVAAVTRLVMAGARPQAILADYRLRGGETGLDAIGVVQAHLGTRVPAIVITGDTAPERLLEVQAGGYRLLHKPVPTHELYRAVADIMQATDNVVLPASQGG